MRHGFPPEEQALDLIDKCLAFLSLLHQWTTHLAWQVRIGACKGHSRGLSPSAACTAIFCTMENYSNSVIPAWFISVLYPRCLLYLGGVLFHLSNGDNIVSGTSGSPLWSTAPEEVSNLALGVFPYKSVTSGSSIINSYMTPLLKRFLELCFSGNLYSSIFP